MTSKEFKEINKRVTWRNGEPPDWYLAQALCGEIERLRQLVSDVHERARVGLEKGDTLAWLGAALGCIQEMTKQEEE